MKVWITIALQIVVTTGVVGQSPVNLISTPRLTTGVVGGEPVNIIHKSNQRSAGLVSIVPETNAKGETIEVIIIERKTTAPVKRR